MDSIRFVGEKKEEILALAARHGAVNVRLVKPSAEDAAHETLKLVADFSHGAQRSNYYDALIEFQEDLESWLGVSVHVYDANGFKGADGQAFLKETIAL